MEDKESITIRKTVINQASIIAWHRAVLYG